MTVKQIVSNLEDIPRIIVMISFIIVSITFVNQDILPNQLQLDFKRMHAFYLTLYSSLYSVLSSFIDSSHLVKRHSIGYCSYIWLYYAVLYQLISRIAPIICACALAVDSEWKSSLYMSGPEHEISLIVIAVMIFCPILVRYLTTYIIYTTPSLSTQDRVARFASLSYAQRWLHILKNTFYVQPLPTLETSTPVRGSKCAKIIYLPKEVLLLFCTCIADIVLYGIFWLFYVLAYDRKVWYVNQNPLPTIHVMVDSYWIISCFFTTEWLLLLHQPRPRMF